MLLKLGIALAVTIGVFVVAITLAKLSWALSKKLEARFGQSAHTFVPMGFIGILITLSIFLALLWVPASQSK